MNIVATGFIFTGFMAISNILMYAFAYHDAKRKMIREIVNEKYFRYDEMLYCITEINENTEHA